ncbi:MAG: MFS transporter, partial [Alphaproteobacteria bacterium]
PSARASEARLNRQERQPQRQVFVELLRVPAVRIVLVMSIGIFFFNHGLNNWLPEILRLGGMTVTVAGFWAAIPVGVGIVAAVLVPRLATPRRRYLVMLGLLLCAVTSSVLLQSSDLPFLLPGLVLQGVGYGTLMAVAMLILVEQPEVQSRRAGTAGGLFFAAAEIGGVLGPLSLGIMFDASGGFTLALVVLTAIMTGLILLLARLRRVAPLA